MNEAGHRTRNGSKFTDITVDRLLRDPSAKGKRRANYTKSIGDKKHWVLKPETEWVYSDVEPIVSEEVWETCNQILEARRADGKRPAKKPVHLFSGVAYCACGQKMYVPSNTPKYVCYKCRNKLPVPDLESIFQEQLRGFFFSDTEVTKYIQQADETVHEKEELLQTLESQYKRLKADMDKLLRLYLDGGISKEGFSAQYVPMETQAKRLEDQIPQLQGEVDFLKIQYLSSDQILSDARDLYSRWHDLQQEEKLKIVENTVEKIIIGRDDVTIELGYLPASSELVAERQRNFIPALPFCHASLRVPRPKPEAHPDVLRTYGGHLRAKRLNLRLFQAQVAEQIGVGETTIFNWENNRVEPAVRLIPRSIRFLGYCPYTPGLPLSVRLKLWRESVGYSQEQMAGELGMDEGTPRRWEPGRRQPVTK